MEKHIVTKHLNSCFVEMQDDILHNVSMKLLDANLEFNTFIIKLNNKGIAPVVDKIDIEENKIELTLKLNSKCFLLYNATINAENIEEHIVLKYNNDFDINDFECFWVCDVDNIGVMPVPFGNHEKKPELLTKYNLDSITCEGAVVSKEKRGIAIAKQPSDREPVWVKITKENDKLFLAAASISGNRGFCDKTVLENDWSIIDFHPTQYLLYTGEIEQGFYSYRKYMSSWGVTMPEGYNPPTNYCIYYECARMDQENVNLNAEEIKECHSMTRDVVYDMAKTAKSLSCDLLYLDQGWDTDFGSLIWDRDRLGDAKELITELKNKGIDVGVLVPLHSSAESYSNGFYTKDCNQSILNGDPWHKFGICPHNEKYGKIRLERLKKLADDGIRFFSYDFHNYAKCYDPTHKHSAPLTPYEHAKAIFENQKKVKEACGNVLIESHDWLDAGIYYYPIYMFGEGHHERWGFEYMWNPLEDYRAGRLQNLYYYNLAYEKPLYIHINLLGIGENAEVYWYFASTVRHFGVGNYSALPSEKQDLARTASATYTRLKKYYATGEFLGINPLVHIHKIKGCGAVINIFSDKDSQNNEYVISKKELGIDNISKTAVCWGRATVIEQEDKITILSEMKENDAIVIEVLE